MKRFLLLLALAAAPACNMTAEAEGGAGTMDKACGCLTRGPVSAEEETWSLDSFYRPHVWSWAELQLHEP